jgi:hypothetical protein
MLHRRNNSCHKSFSVGLDTKICEKFEERGGGRTDELTARRLP